MSLEIPLRGDRADTSGGGTRRSMHSCQKLFKKRSKHVHKYSADDIKEVVDIGELEDTLVCDLEKCEP